MNELPPDARALLSLAKASHEPTDPLVKERVRQQVQLAVAASAAGGLLSASTAKATTVVAKGGLFSSVVGKVGIAAVALGVVGGGGALLQARSAVHRVEQSQERTVAKEVASPAPVGASVPVVAPAPEQAAAEAEAKTVTGDERAAARVAAPHNAARGAASLPAELKLLKAASEALSRGDLVRGSTLLREHRQRFAQPMLREERDGLELVARCQRGDQDARASALKFIAEHGSSMVTATIKQACKLEPNR